MNSFLIFTLILTLWSTTNIVAQEVIAPYQVNDTLIYLQSVNFTVRNENPALRSTLKFDGAATVNSVTNTNVAVTVTYPEKSNGNISVNGFSFQMTFSKSSGYWVLGEAKMSANAAVKIEGGKQITVDYKDKEIIPLMEFQAPLAMSFHCGRFGPLAPKVPKVKKDNNATATATAYIELIDFQFQTFMKNNSKFGRSYDCVGFFSIGILSGWFITIILLGILTWGIKMVMSVHTMDRFDDPKGKSIAVNAQE